MTYVLVREATRLATFDDEQREIDDASVLIGDAGIVLVGKHSEVMREVDERGIVVDHEIDARDHVVLPGFVNTHHHFFQTLTRAVPGGQDAELFDWLVTHYPIWARIDARSLRNAAQIAAAELLLSGCTTAADHTYLWAHGCRVDDLVDSVSEIGLRFHCSRGSMSVGESKGGLPPDSVVESEDRILADTRRAIETYHDRRRFSMTHITVAPCSPFSVSSDLMVESARLARSYGVHLHTHLAETRDEEAYCKQTLGATPVEFAERVGWVGDDVWFAHMVHPSSDEISRLGSARCGAAHCPTSNMRLGSGIAPIREMLGAGMRVGLGVDGSASNDSSNMLAEARQAMLLQRVGGAIDVGARDVLRLATRGGADVLGRDDIGRIEPGFAADLIGFRLDTLELAGGAVHDPVASLVFCQPPRVSFSIVNGKERVLEGSLVDVDLPSLVRAHNKAAVNLIEG